MLNIHDLERQWLKYKIKSYIPLATGGMASIIALILVIIYLPSEEKIQTQPLVAQIQVPAQVIIPPAKEIKTSINISVPQNTTPVQEEIVIPKVQDSSPHDKKVSSTLVLKPSLHFMDNIEDGISPYVEEDYSLHTQVSIQEGAEVQNTNSRFTTSANTVTSTSLPIQEKKSGLSITSNNNKDDLKDVIRRFKQNKNPALSLFIAKRYYADGKYQKSYNYALMTNEIDKSIDESWLIFSKSLVKLGQHELAINTLKSYIKNTKSTGAEVLLRKIEAGTFR